MKSDAESRKRGKGGVCFRALRLAAACAGLPFTGLLLAEKISAGEQQGLNAYHLTLTSGETLTGRLLELDVTWSVRLGDGSTRRVAGEEIVSLRRAGAVLPPFPVGEQIVFANGDRLPGKVLELAGERLSFRSGLGRDEEMRLPISSLAVIWLTAPDGVERPGRFVRRLAAAPRRRDAVLLRNGDVLEGLVTGLDAKTRLRVEVAKKPVAVEFPTVAAVGLNTELARQPRPRALYGRLVLANGGRLTVASAHSDGVTFSGKALFGIEVTVPLAEVIALDVCGGRVVYLSDLKARRYEAKPYLDLRWPYETDASVVGDDLRLGENSYGTGLGMHSGSRLTYDLAGGYRRFEALVGLDRTGRQGSASVRVLVDGRAQDLGWDGKLSGKTPPRWIQVGVDGARELTLAVDFGRFGDVRGRVDWVDARLIR